MAKYIDREKLIPDRCYCEPYGYQAVSCQQIFQEYIADVVAREKIDKAIEEIERYGDGFDYIGKHNLGSAVENCIKILKRNIGE